MSYKNSITKKEFEEEIEKIYDWIIKKENMKKCPCIDSCSGINSDSNICTTPDYRRCPSYRETILLELVGNTFFEE